MKIHRILGLFAITILGLISMFNIIESLSHIFTLKTKLGQVDFHSYWYSGQFVRQAQDPYQAYFEGRTLAFPLHFINGSTATQDETMQRAEALETTPANTAPVVLLMTVFSLFPWHLAASMWIICNVVFAFLIPWLLWRFINPNKTPIPPIVYSLLFLVMLSFNLTARGVIGNGQTTFLVMFLMFLALVLMDEQKDILAGIVLGIALSKYSVALPVFLLI